MKFCFRYSRLFDYIIKNHKTVTDNPWVRTYVIKIGNRITFKIKKGYYLHKLLMPQSIKLLGSAKSKITKDKYSENVPHLDIRKWN